jgi:hypothetical protein
MPEGGAIAGLLVLCALVILLVIGTLIGAVCLRAAVALYDLYRKINDRMAGEASSHRRVPRLAFGKAMWISFNTCVAQMLLGLYIGGVRDTGPLAPGAHEKGADVVTQLISLPVSLLIMAALLSRELPTTFGRAILLVIFCHLIIVMLVVGVIVAIAVV